MIDVKDLQIGNKVLYQNKVVEIATTHITGTVGISNGHKDFIANVGCKDIEPILITPYKLKKIGFDNSDYPNEEGYSVYCKEHEDYFVSICKSKNKWFCEIDCNRCDNAGNFYLTYMHELQNIFRLITKGDLEVCL